MMWIILISCVVVVAAAQEVPKCDVKPCCTPKQWEGYEAPFGGIVVKKKAGLIAGLGCMHYDAYNHMAASVRNVTVAGRHFAIKVVLRESTLYVVNLIERKCYKKQMPQGFKESCIPKNAKCAGHFYYGAGRDTLHGDTFYMTVNKGSTKLKVFASVTKKCIPIGEAFVGRIKDARIEESVGFFNIRLGIKDPSVFDVPRVCNDESFELISASSELKQFRILGF